jgi:predicted Fe-S protein YdhL (DUF1289 family)
MAICVRRGAAYGGAASDSRIMPTIISPCEKICTVDPGSGLCSGCGRSLEEIASWTSYSDAERARVMQELPRRLTAMGLGRTPPPVRS